MRILVFFDTPRQRNYLNKIYETFSDSEDVEIIAAGPGCSVHYFGREDQPELDAVEPTNFQLASWYLMGRVGGLGTTFLNPVDEDTSLKTLLGPKVSKLMSLALRPFVAMGRLFNKIADFRIETSAITNHVGRFSFVRTLFLWVLVVLAAPFRMLAYGRDRLFQKIRSRNTIVLRSARLVKNNLAKFQTRILQLNIQSQIIAPRFKAARDRIQKFSIRDTIEDVRYNVLPKLKPGRRQNAASPKKRKKKQKEEPQLSWISQKVLLPLLKWSLAPLFRVAMIGGGFTAGVIGVLAIPLFTRMNWRTPLRYFMGFAEQLRFTLRAERLLENVRADVLIMMEDNVQGLTGFVAASAKMRSLPLVILPDYIPNPKEPAQFYISYPSHKIRTLYQQAFAVAHPEWIYEYEKQSLFRLPVNQIIAHKLLQKNEVSPWILHAGFADKILLDSPTALSSYETLEFINQKIRVVGSGIDDTIYETFTQRKAIKRRLLKKHKMPENKMLLICAFPPDQFSVYTPAFEHKTFENLCGSWFEELGKISNRFNILIKPHPRLGVKALKKFETDSIKILDTPTEQLLPLADLYVACVSTTIRWALALGIPVINYDCFRYDYGDFYDAKGVMEATSQSQFRGHLNFFTPENLKKMTEVAYKDKANWGLLDGKYETRLRHEIEETFTIAKLPNPTHLN